MVQANPTADISHLVTSKMRKNKKYEKCEKCTKGCLPAFWLKDFF